MTHIERNHSLVVYIGRFQPFHLGHKAVIEKALEQGDKVAVVIGSHDAARSPKNPWTSAERIEMISASLDAAQLERVLFVKQEDHLYNLDRWLTEITSKIEGLNRANISTGKHRNGPYSIALIGVEKDESSFYLKHFPQWSYIDATPDRLMNATDIRRLYFGSTEIDEGSAAGIESEWDNSISPEIADWLAKWKNQNAQTYHFVAAEQEFYAQYRAAWKDAPYPPTFYAADALVVSSAHILLVNRRARPGQGLLALPGGFVDQRERGVEAALRELREETQLKVPKAILRGSIDRSKFYDDPGRSLRGRLTTLVTLIRLPNEELPKVKGGDDAFAARWVPLADLKRDQFFEDHFDIIEDMMGF